MIDIRIIVPCFDWPDLLQECLESIAGQSYPRFGAMIVVDGQPRLAGGALRLLNEMGTIADCRERQWAHTLAPERGGELASIIRGTQMLNEWPNVDAVFGQPMTDETVICHVCADDALSHPGALARLAAVYEDPDVWMTYGQYRIEPGGALGHCRGYPADVVAAGSYRAHPWLASHLRSYRYGLWRRIPEEQFIDPETGKVWFYATDRAMMLPMLEMAREHARFIPDVLYAYRRHNGNVHPALDQGHAARVAAMPRLPRLETL